jgi:hypothetical protein
MAISYKSKFIDGWLEQGHAIGMAEGRAEGEVTGATHAKADAILRVFKSRDLHLSHARRELIETCKDLAQLDAWFDRSLTATTVDEIFEDEEG